MSVGGLAGRSGAAHIGRRTYLAEQFPARFEEDERPAQADEAQHDRVGHQVPVRHRPEDVQRLEAARDEDVGGHGHEERAAQLSPSFDEVALPALRHKEKHVQRHRYLGQVRDD